MAILEPVYGWATMVFALIKLADPEGKKVALYLVGQLLLALPFFYQALLNLKWYNKDSWTNRKIIVNSFGIQVISCVSLTALLLLCVTLYDAEFEFGELVTNLMATAIAVYAYILALRWQKSSS